MRLNPGESLRQWWKTASPRSRWTAGVLLFSLLATGAFFAISGAPADQPAGVSSTSGFDVSTWELVGAFFKLLLVIGLIVGCGILLRKYSNKQPLNRHQRQLEVIETVRLSPRQSMHIVRAGDKTLLVGATDQMLSLISEVDLPQGNEEAAASSQTPAFSFQSILSGLVSNLK